MSDHERASKIGSRFAPGQTFQDTPSNERDYHAFSFHDTFEGISTLGCITCYDMNIDIPDVRL